MKSNKSQIWSGILVLLLFAGLIFLVYKLLVFTISKADTINPNIFVVLIASTVTIIGYFITRYLERKKLIEQQIREQKVPVYEEFIDFFFSLFQNSKTSNIIDSKEFEDFFWKMNKKSVLWLSDKTFKSYINWKKTTARFADVKDRSETENIKMLLLFEKLLLDFREDIGHKNKNLENGDLLSLFLNDWEKIKK